MDMLRNNRSKLFFVELIILALFLISLVVLLTNPSPSEAYLSALYTINVDNGRESVFLKDSNKEYGKPAWSPDGHKIAFTSSIVDGNTRDLYVVDADGKNQSQLTRDRAYSYYPAWSPDGRSILFTTSGFLDVLPWRLHIIDIDANVETSLTKTIPGDEGYSSWSPNGKQIVYDAWIGSDRWIFVANPDGTRAHSITDGFLPAWSPDGYRVAFAAYRDEHYDIFVMNSDGSDQHNLTNDAAWDNNPVWSPDGQHIAFLSTSVGGSSHIFLMNNDGGGIKDLMPASTLSVYYLAWSPDGQQIIFNAIQSNTASQDYSRINTFLRIKVILSTVLLSVILLLANRFLRVESPRSKSSTVEEALNHLEMIQNPILKWIFRILPWLLISATLIGLTPAFNFYPPVLRYFLHESSLYYSGIVTAAISLLIFQILLQRIPEAFHTIWYRNVIKGNRTAKEEISSIDAEAAKPERQYQEFIDNLDQWLNHPRQFVMGIVCGILGASWIFYDIGFSDLKSAGTRLLDPFFIVQFLIGFGIGYIVGLQVWRMIVIGYQVRQLGKKFDLALQLGHPDGCEGLSPLGNLCLWNALIVSPAGIDLGGWLIFGNTSYQSLLYFLLLVVLAIASASFFVPLWNVHENMAAQRDAVRKQLDQLGENMNQLARQLLERADELETAENEKIAKKLELMRQTYLDNQQINTWPFNTRTLAKFITSQIVPLLSLTGLGQPIKDIIFRLADLIK